MRRTHPIAKISSTTQTTRTGSFEEPNFRTAGPALKQGFQTLKLKFSLHCPNVNGSELMIESKSLQNTGHNTILFFCIMEKRRNITDNINFII